MFGRIAIIFLLTISFANAKYYKCFYSKDDVIDYSNSIALFIEDNYISVMDNIYHVNADFVEKEMIQGENLAFIKKKPKTFYIKQNYIKIQ